MLVFDLLFVILIVCRKIAKVVSTINKKNTLKNAFQYFFETNV